MLVENVRFSAIEWINDNEDLFRTIQINQGASASANLIAALDLEYKIERKPIWGDSLFWWSGKYRDNGKDEIFIDSRETLAKQAELLAGQVNAVHDEFLSNEVRAEWWLVGTEHRYRDYATNWQGKKIDTALKQAEAKMVRLKQYVEDEIKKELVSQGVGHLAGKGLEDLAGKGLEAGGQLLAGVSVWFAGVRRSKASWKAACIEEYKEPKAGLIKLAIGLGGLQKIHGHHIVMKGAWKQWFHKELRHVLKESRKILKDAGIDYRDDIKNLTLAVNHHKNHSLEYATEVLRRLRMAVKNGSKPGFDVPTQVSKALDDIRKSLSNGEYIIP